MLKKILLVAAVAFPMFASAQTVKIGIVDTNAIIQALPETKEAQTKLESTSKSYEEEYKKLGDEMNRRLDEFRNMNENEPQAIKERKARELEEYQQKIQQFEQSAGQDLQRLQNELMAPIMQKVNSAINSVGKEGNFTLIQDNNPAVVLYYGAPAINITDEVKAKLGVK